MSRSSEHSVTTRGPAPYSVPALAVVVTAMLLAGCTRSSFLGRQLDDLTARYNTHYNANRTFNEAERRLLREDEPVDMDRYLLVYEVPAVTGRSAEFEQVIEKSADLLRKHPHSKWVDDALMLIGKSYFYQANYVGAEQKFNEVIALASSLQDEGTFWKARTLVASQSGQAAEDLIRTALASENLDDKWRPRLHLLLGDLRTDVSDWEGAIEALEIGLDDIDNGDLAARAEFLLGQLLETVGDYEGSIEAYRRVRDRGPLYELSFASMYSQYRVEGLHRDPEEALEGLQKMARDNKHFQYLDRIEYLMARVHAAEEDPLAARRMLRDILYPPPGQRATSIRGEVHYRLAEIDRDLTGNFHRAAAHFDTAASALRSTNVQNEVFTPDAIVNPRTTAEVFAEYDEVSERIGEMDSLLHLGTLDDDEFDAAVKRVREQLAIEARQAAEEIERRQAQSSFRRVAQEGANANQGGQNTTAGGQAGRFGFLNHKDIRLVQENFISFRQVWGDRPLIPGWRREEVVLSTRSEQQGDFDKAGGVAQEQTGRSGGILNFLPPVDISRVPRDSASRAEMKGERSAERYKLANILFLSMGLPDSAAHWYRLVIDEADDESVSLRAKYAMAEVHQALGDIEAADQMMTQIIRNNPESVFADRARVNLGIEIQADAPDSLEAALAQYSTAYRHWNDGDFQVALNDMMRTAADYPRTEVAAKAMLAGAAIFSDMARHDSLDLFGIIPVGDSVFTAEELARATAGLEADSTAAADSAAVDSLAMALVDSIAAPPEQEIADDLKTEPDEAVTTEDEPVTEPYVPPKPQTEKLEELKAAIDAREQEADSAVAAAPKPEVLEPPDEQLAEDDSDRELRPVREPVDPDDDQLRIGDRPREDVVADVPDEVPMQDLRPDEAMKADTTDQIGVQASEGAVADAIKGVEQVADSTAGGDVQVDHDVDATAQDSIPEVAEVIEEAPPEPPAWIEPTYYINDIIPQPLTLHALFGAVAQHFSDSEYGTRATSLKQGLVAYRDELFAPPPDTTRTMNSPPAVGAQTRARRGDSGRSLARVDE